MVCLSVSWSALQKLAEPIEMPFAVWTQVGPRNHVLDKVCTPCEGAILGGNVICMADGLPKEQSQQFFYSGIRALEKHWTRCISVAGNHVEK